MNWFSLSFGVFSLLYGLFTIYARLKMPHTFAKLNAMKQQHGERAGTLLHTISYTIIPLFYGVLMILAGINGISVFGK